MDPRFICLQVHTYFWLCFCITLLERQSWSRLFFFYFVVVIFFSEDLPDMLFPLLGKIICLLSAFFRISNEKINVMMFDQLCLLYFHCHTFMCGLNTKSMCKTPLVNNNASHSSCTFNHIKCQVFEQVIITLFKQTFTHASAGKAQVQLKAALHLSVARFMPTHWNNTDTSKECN